MTRLFGLFALKETVNNPALHYARVTGKACCEKPTGLPEGRGGAVIGHNNGVYFAEQTAKAERQLNHERPFRKMFLRCGGRNTNPDDAWSYLFGYMNYPGNVNSGSVVSVRSAVATIDGKIEGSMRSPASGKEEIVSRIETIMSNNWPDSLIRLRKEILDVCSPRDAYHLILVSKEIPNCILVLSKNKDNLSIKVNTDEKVVILSSGTPAQKFSIFDNVVGRIGDTKSLTVRSTGAIVFDLEHNYYLNV